MKEQFILSSMQVPFMYLKIAGIFPFTFLFFGLNIFISFNVSS